MNLSTIAAIQPPFYEKKSEENNNAIIDRGIEYLEHALARGAKYCCLPEVFNTFGVSSAEAQRTCENWKDILDRVALRAARFKAYVVLPLLMRENGKYYNRACLIGPDGSEIGHYNKIHTTICEREELDLQSGTEVGIFDLPDVRVAIVICYDLYFPELFSTLMRLEPDIIFVPSLQRSDHEPANEARMKTRAMDTMAYLVRSSFGCAVDATWTPGLMFGQSSIIHPDGTFLANAGHYEGVALAAVHLPFEWKRPRCGGGRTEPVRSFIREDDLNYGQVD